MGTTTGWNSRKETIKHLITPHPTAAEGAGMTHLATLAHCVRGNILWAVQKWEHLDDPFIGCYILVGPVKDKRGFYSCGYRGYCESEHVSRYNCPVRYLDMAPETCPEWRAIVRREAAAKATPLKVGLIAELKGCKIPAVEVTSVRPLRGRADWTTYRLKRSLLSGRTFASWDEFKETQEAKA